jgi:predicted nucleotidyltransferase
VAHSSIDLTDRPVLEPLRHYADADNRDRLYADEGEAFTAFGFDLEAAGAWLLGKDARQVLDRGPDPRVSLRGLTAILQPQIDPDGTLQLVGEMPPADREHQLALLTAFHAGLVAAHLRKH